MSLRSIVFWYNAPTVHQYALIRALANEHAPRITVAAFNELLPDRREMGWEEPDFGAATRVIVRSEAARREIIAAHAGPDSLHVFSGIHGFPPVYRSLRAVMRTGARIGVMAIGPETRGIAGLLRFAKHRAYATRVRHRVDFVLASGHMGVAWYRSVGFAADRVFEFGNFSNLTNPAASRHAGEPAMRLIYVGTLTKRKGVEVLLRALAALPPLSWSLQIVGDGPLKPALRALAADLDLNDRVEWSGFRAHAAACELLGQADLAVLPSLHDGWGSVVNEALLAGTPAICTDHCGAAVVVSGSGRGHVVTAGSVAELRGVLRLELARGRRSADQRAQIRAWAACLGPESGAEYFRSILRHVFEAAAWPVPPWRSE